MVWKSGIRNLVMPSSLFLFVVIHLVIRAYILYLVCKNLMLLYNIFRAPNFIQLHISSHNLLNCCPAFLWVFLIRSFLWLSLLSLDKVQGPCNHFMIYKSSVLVKEGIEIVINKAISLWASLITRTLPSFSVIYGRPCSFLVKFMCQLESILILLLEN